MNKQKKIQLKRKMRKARTRAKIAGTASCPRLSVFRSNCGMYFQLIDDKKGITLASAHTKEIKEKTKGKVEISFATGKLLAEKAIKKGIDKAVFDKGGFKYHGRVKAGADGAREGGLKF